MYQVSKITTYDEDKMLYETYVGLTNKEMTLICSAFGETEQDSKENATRLAQLLTANIKS